jgi:glycosyltransferase involved in cell wall biosynthesis
MLASVCKNPQWRYCLVTPARNEEALIGFTLESVVRQTILPAEWIIVSDQSTDRTDEIVLSYAANYPFIKLRRLEQRPKRSFASVVFALEAGIGVIQCKDYQFIGLLDSDVKFGPDYYEQIIARFQADSKLGLAGGLVVDCINGVRASNLHSKGESLRDVAGAVQFFSRDCFAALGGLMAVPEGGWDTLTCVQARHCGYHTQTFSEIEVDHLKPRNIAEGNVIRRNQQMGEREYALGYHPLFEVVKCGYRCLDRPLLVGGLSRLWGYVSCYLRGRKRIVPDGAIKQIRQEQLNRLFWFSRKASAS